MISVTINIGPVCVLLYTTLQKGVNALQEWTQEWFLKLNASKCMVMSFGGRNVEKSYTYNILENSQIKPLTRTDQIKDLGIFSQPSIYIDGWLYATSMTSVVCNVPVLSQNDSTYHHSVFTT